MTEEWRWIKGYEEKYQISNFGRFKSFLSDKENGKIRQIVNKNGWYLTVNLQKKVDGKSRKTTAKIHRLVYQTFVGDIPKGFHIHHKDGNKQNNHLDNLVLLHPSDHASESVNQRDSVSKMVNYNVHIKPRRVRQYTLEGEYLAEYVNCAIAEVFTGVCQRDILHVANHTPYGKNNHTRKQAGGYAWKFADEVEENVSD